MPSELTTRWTLAEGLASYDSLWPPERFKRPFHFDHGRRFTLHAWVVMPNHVHVLLTPLENVALEEILRTQKSISSTRINKLLGQQGRLWQPDYFDRLIRDEKHFNGVVHYIEWNPVKAGLCVDPADWAWSSAYRHARQLEPAD
ncbi:MAG TPA: transposase [Fimbriimonadaceae bacterium]|nr:transposase [Fimbriimonadaceae bacterium]